MVVVKETRVFGLSGRFTRSSCHHAKISAENIAKKLRRTGYKARITKDKRAVWYPYCVWKKKRR